MVRGVYPPYTLSDLTTKKPTFLCVSSLRLKIFYLYLFVLNIFIVKSYLNLRYHYFSKRANQTHSLRKIYLCILSIMRKGQYMFFNNILFHFIGRKSTPLCYELLHQLSNLAVLPGQYSIHTILDP